MAFTASSEERDQISALKTHQRTVRGHKALTDALADAQTDHAVAGSERSSAKDALFAALQDV